MLKLIFLIIAAIVIWTIITQPEAAGQNVGPILQAAGEFAKTVLVALVDLIKIVSTTLSSDAKG